MRLFLISIFILWSCASFCSVQAMNITPIYLIEVSNIYKVGNCILFFLAILPQQSKYNGYCGLILIIGLMFCITFTIIELYPWLPDNIKLIPYNDKLSMVDFSLWLYFLIWIAIGLLTLIYSCICYKRKLL